jgi:hypothetical protein
MAVLYTTNLALGQPVTGTESGTWGDDVNNSVTAYLDIAIAGGLAITITTTDVTLTNTQGTSIATNIGSTTAQYAILNISGVMTGARNLIVPSSSKSYIVNNDTTGGYALTVKGAATTGVSLINGEKCVVAWNGTDYVKIASTVITALGTPTSGTLSNCTVDGVNSIGYLNIPQNSKSASYTTVLADSGKCIFHPTSDANARTFTIAANASVPYAIGTVIQFVNMSTQVLTIAISADTMYLVGTGSTGSKSLAQYGVANAMKMTSTTWILTGSGLS